MPFSTKQIELIETLSGKITSGLDDIFKACGAIYGAEEANHINTAETAKTFIGQLFHKNNDPNSSSTEQNSEGSSQRRYILSQIQGLIITLNDEICKHNLNKKMLPQEIEAIKTKFNSEILAKAKKFKHPLSDRKVHFATALIDICAMLLFKQLDIRIILDFANRNNDDLQPKNNTETPMTLLPGERIQELRKKQTKCFNEFFPQQNSILDSPCKSQPSKPEELTSDEKPIEEITTKTGIAAELLKKEHETALAKNDSFQKSENTFSSLIHTINHKLAILRQKNLNKAQKNLSLDLNDLLCLEQDITSLAAAIPSFESHILSLEAETNRLMTLCNNEMALIQKIRANPVIKNETTRADDDRELRRLTWAFEEAYANLNSAISSEETELSSILTTLEIRLKSQKEKITSTNHTLSEDSRSIKPYTTALTTEHSIYASARTNFTDECRNQDNTYGMLDRTWHTLAANIEKTLTDIKESITSSLDEFYKYFPQLDLAHENKTERDITAAIYSLKDHLTVLSFEKEKAQLQYQTKIAEIQKATTLLNAQDTIAQNLKDFKSAYEQLKPFTNLAFIEKLKEKLNAANAIIESTQEKSVQARLQQTKNDLERLQTRVQTLMISFGMSLKQNQKILFDRLNNNPDVNITDKEIAAQQRAFKTSVSETQFQLYADICNLKVNTALLANDAPLKTLEERVSSHNEKKSQIPYRAKGIKWGGIAGLGVTAIIVGVMITLTILTSGISLPIFITLAAFAAFAPLKGAIVGYTIGRNRDKNTKPKTNETPEDMLDAVDLNESQKGTRIVTAPTEDEINNRTMHGRRMQSIYSALTPDTPSPEQHTSSHPVSISESDDSTDTDETSSPVTTPASSSPPQFNLENSDNNSTSTIREILTPKPQLTFEELAEKATKRAERAIARHSSGSHDRLEPIPAPKANYIQHTNTRAETIQDTYVHGHSATFFEGQVKIQFSRRRASPQKVQGETSHPVTPSKNTGT